MENKINAITKPLVVERLLNAPLNLVWKAFTDVNEMNKWYFQMQGFELKTGCEFTFKGRNEDGVEYIHLCKILEIVPNKKLVHTWSYQNIEGSSIVSIEFYEEGNQTRIKLSHQGLESFPAGIKSFAIESFTAGWNEIIGKLLPEYLQK